MIASESIQSKNTLMLAGSAFNNKTATGSVGKQRLLGAEYADQLERMAAKRACEVFHADYANMLTYSGTVANFCAYEAVLNPNDPVLALSHSVGAHQSHGGMGNVSSKFYRFQYFGEDPETMDVDYDEAERKAAKYAIIRHFSQKRKLAYGLQYYWAGGRPGGVAGTAPDGAAH